MIQLYKKREFGELFSDTFAFLRQTGKHFYKNYFLINGAFILVLMVLAYFFMKVYTSLLATSQGPINPDATIENYFNDNALLIVIFMAVFALVAVFVTFITYIYTPVYMLLYAKKGAADFTTKDIVNTLKKNTGKLFIYFFASMLISLAVFLGGGIAILILFVTGIGIFLIPLVVAVITLSYNNAFMEYLDSGKGIFNCFEYGLQLTFKRFWVSAGCVALFYFMIQIIQGIMTLIPYLVGIFSVFTSSSSLGSDPDESMGILLTIMLVFYVLSFLLGLVGNTVVQMNQGIVYFSLKEENENINTASVIDQIGTSGD
ncbi:hypothetical protein [Sinomicrobium weinanense]|uniref:Glycerophosphoryl diester phosphodiesterase membrane domain-containing protein n=1 Tax=Sinomicrobium weinanense TaxID=2842200 RepID=A0A926JSM5_9FLAO|nr:hypothetical protein [Sinomicrobium weinanense]MBC9796574.1 hypothetical protein [Sinomicrobium weinanense]MBU3123558.1 hypothetical protein [Sinomicrobium weinanense]